jgi:hypothetical protein
MGNRGAPRRPHRGELAALIGHGRNWASLIRRQLSVGHDDALDVRARFGENALHVKIFAHGSSYCGVAPPRARFLLYLIAPYGLQAFVDIPQHHEVGAIGQVAFLA